MRPRTTSVFSLLLLLLVPQPSFSYSLKNCTADFADRSVIVCDFNRLTAVPPGIPKTATSLSLFVNRIEQIGRTDFADFARLESLHLGENLIAHVEDAAFADLSALTDLIFAFNKLTTLTDETFAGLSNLTTLNLNCNQIHSVSTFAFRPLTKLEFLDMSYNKLVQLSGIDFSYFPAIKNLYLSTNLLTSFESSVFRLPLSNLARLDLNSNPLVTFSICSDVFPNLQQLGLSGPDFDWDVSRGSLTSVKSLVLSTPLLSLQTYESVFRSVDSVENVFLLFSLLNPDIGLLRLTCKIPTLRRLKATSNDIPILDETILRSCSRLSELHLQDNSMKGLSESSLRVMTRLTRLTIESNELTRIPTTIRNMSTITYLSFAQNQITDLQCSDFSHLTSLSELDLNSNRISKLDSCMFKDLSNLKILNIKNNFISLRGDSFGVTLDRLTSLDASGNSFRWLQKGTFQNLKSLEELDLKSDRDFVLDRDAFEGLSSLKHLTYFPSYSYIGHLAGFAKLEKLVMFLTYDQARAAPSRDLFLQMPSLTELNVIVDQQTCFSWTSNFLQSLTNLKVLSFEKYCCDVDGFVSSPTILQFEMIDCSTFGHRPELFRPLKDLKVLDLTNSNIQSLDFLTDANLTKVEKLILKNNKLMILNEEVFEALPSLEYLDLTGNPFVCNCSNVGFIDWAIRNKQVQVVNAFQYTCSAPPSEEGHFLMDFNVQSCWESASFLCFMSSSALVLVTLLLSFVHHFLRWQLVYGFYLLQAFLYDSKKRRQGCPHIYDAFVSYNVHDEDWVYGELMPQLERGQGWRLCLHHRDFTPGKPIIENITDAVYSSRKTLCVISRRYLQSEWCSREIQLASFRLFDEKEDVLILLFLEEISSNQLSPFYRMRKLMKSRTYLSWTPDRSHQGLFWERVRRALECGNQPGDGLLAANI